MAKWKAKVDGNKIIITKKELEETRDHYRKISEKLDKEGQKLKSWFFMGEYSVCNDLLKCFDTEELDFI